MPTNISFHTAPSPGVFMRLEMRGLGFAGEGGDDVAAEGGARLGIGGRIAVGTGGVFVETLLPAGTQSGVIEDGFGLGNRRRESIQGALAGRRNGTFVGVLHHISMGLPIAGAENDFVGAGEFARHGIERMSENGTCHIYEVLVSGCKGINYL